MSCGNEHTDDELELPQEALDATPEGEPTQTQNGNDTTESQHPEPVEGGGI